MWRKFTLRCVKICKICKKLRCFLEKFTQLTKLLHDRRSRRSRQIPSLPSPITHNSCSYITIPRYIWGSWEWNSLRGLCGLPPQLDFWERLKVYEYWSCTLKKCIWTAAEEENGKNIIEQSFLKKSVVNVKVWLCGYSSDAECLETFLLRHKFTRQRISNVPKAQSCDCKMT